MARRPARPNAAVDGILFQLVLYFRRFTHGIRNPGIGFLGWPPDN